MPPSKAKTWIFVFQRNDPVPCFIPADVKHLVYGVDHGVISFDKHTTATRAMQTLHSIVGEVKVHPAPSKGIRLSTFIEYCKKDEYYESGIPIP